MKTIGAWGQKLRTIAISFGGGFEPSSYIVQNKNYKGIWNYSSEYIGVVRLKDELTTLPYQVNCFYAIWWEMLSLSDHLNFNFQMVIILIFSDEQQTWQI